MTDDNTLRIIFTEEEKKVARRAIDDFRRSYVIDTKEMILEHDYVPGMKITTAQNYIIQQNIEKKLRQAINNKKSKQVIYFHHRLNPYVIRNIRDFFDENDATFEFLLFDPDHRLVELHEAFDGVL